MSVRVCVYVCVCAHTGSGTGTCTKSHCIISKAPWRTQHQVWLSSRLAPAQHPKATAGPGEPLALLWHVPASLLAHAPRWSYGVQGSNGCLLPPEPPFALPAPHLFSTPGPIKGSTGWRGEHGQTSSLLFFSASSWENQCVWGRPGIRGGFQRREEEGWGQVKECQTVIDVPNGPLNEQKRVCVSCQCKNLPQSHRVKT